MILNDTLSRLMANKHTTAAGMVYGACWLACEIAPVWFPSHAEQIKTTSAKLKEFAILYGFAMAGDARTPRNGDGDPQPPTDSNTGSTMKKIAIIIGLASLLFSATAKAQTNLPAAAPTFGSTSNLLSGLGANDKAVSAITTTLGFLNDAQPYITNGDCLLEIGALRHGSSYGALIDLQLPVNTNSWQVTYGVALAYLNRQLYSGALNVGLGTTVPVPIVGKWTGPVYAFAESGPAYNLSKHQLTVQSFVGVKYALPLTSKIGIGASASYGSIADLPGSMQAYTGFLTVKF